MGKILSIFAAMLLLCRFAWADPYTIPLEDFARGNCPGGAPQITLTAGSCAYGVFSSGTVTNPITSQVLIGSIDTAGTQSFTFESELTSGGGSISVMESADQVTWQTVYFQAYGNAAANGGMQSAFSVTSGYTIVGPVHQRYLRVTAGASTGVYSVSGYLRTGPYVSNIPFQNIFSTAISSLSSTFAGFSYAPALTTSRYLVVLPYSMPETTWQYSTGGSPITTATTTTLQAAQATSVRNYLTTMYCDNSAATAEEIQILDGSTIIADRYIPANASNFAVMLAAGSIPLRGSTATAMNFKTFGTGSLYCSAQGFAAY